MVFHDRIVTAFIATAGLLAIINADAHADAVSGEVFGRWTLAQSPIVVTGDCHVATGLSLAVDPGVRVLFAPGTGILVDGTLSGISDGGHPIVFDQNEPSPWRCIDVTATGQALFANCIIRGGGYSDETTDGCTGMVRIDGGQVTMSGTSVSGSASSGVYVNAGSLAAQTSYFADNGGSTPTDAGIHVATGILSLGAGATMNSITAADVYGLYNEDIIPVSAPGTWWGSANGPQSPDNIDGDGASVSDDVDFSNFALAGPSPVPGDVNGDGTATFADVAPALSIAAGILDATTQQVLAADVYPTGAPDGVVDVRDAVHLLRAMAGLEPL